MPIKATQLHLEQHTFDWPYAEDILKVTYRPGAITPAMEGRLEEIAASDFQQKAVMEVLFGHEGAPGVLIDLDGLVEDDGTTKIPITAERFSQLPTLFLADLMVAIQADAQPSSEEGKA